MAERLELSGWEFKADMINKIRTLMGKVDNMQEQWIIEAKRCKL